MRRINLIGENLSLSCEGVVTPEVMRERFFIRFDENELLKVRDMDVVQAQKFYDSRFADDRREEMLACASEDKSGRKVRYFRYMRRDRFLDLLNRGFEIADGGEQIEYSEDDLVDLLSELACYHYEMNGIDCDDFGDTISKDLIYSAFPSISVDELNKVLNGTSLQFIKMLVDKYVSRGVQNRLHTGSRLMQFCSLLSVSVAAPIKEFIGRGEIVYVEMVIPDQSIVLNKNYFEGEKEVLDYIRSGKDSNIAEYFSENKQILTGFDDVVNRWRWDTSLNDYLPISLADKIVNN